MTNQIPKESVPIIYEKGIWIAEPAKKEIYAPGTIFIRAEKDEINRVPRFLGERNIPDKKDLLKVIDMVSQAMLKSLDCERIYCVSLCEDQNDNLRLHFRLFPRYREDKGFLDELDTEIKNTNDGLALMARSF